MAARFSYALALYAAMLIACFLRYGAVLPEALDAHVPDDTYYYLQIAQHVAAGHGSCFSPGEPTNGYHPLWLWVLSALTWALPLSRDAMALLCVALSAVLTAASAMPFSRFLAATGLDAERTRFCTLVYLVNPWVACLALSGMETGLLLFLLFALLALVADGSRTRLVDALGFGVTAGLLMLARTDSIFFTAAAFLYFALARARGWRWLLVAGATSMLVLGPYLFWSYTKFGSIQQSSSDAISFIEHAQMSGKVADSLRAGIDLFTRMSAVTLVYPFVRFPEYNAPYQQAFGIVFAALCVAHLARRSLGPVVPLRIPIWFWGPVLLLAVYYCFFRHFFQVWHEAPAIVLCVLVASSYLARMRHVLQVCALLVLASLSLWATRNGFYSPQAGGIAAVRTFAAQPRPRQLIGHTDSGSFAYFGRDEVVNLDGVVNNAALTHIRAGRLCDYLIARRFDRVIMSPARFDLYNREVRTEPTAELPPRDPAGELRGFVDRTFVTEDGRVRIDGWVTGDGCDAAATMPMLALLDVDRKPLVAFTGERRYRDDVARGLDDDQQFWSGCEFRLRTEQIPPEARLVRLGTKSRQGTSWTVDTWELVRP